MLKPIELLAAPQLHDSTVSSGDRSGDRGAIATSLLQRHGFEHVINVPGSWLAWKTAGLPMPQP